jgi:hypothetical protein
MGAVEGNHVDSLDGQALFIYDGADDSTGAWPCWQDDAKGGISADIGEERRGAAGLRSPTLDA